MKRIEIRESEYIGSLVMMLMGLDRLKVSTPCRFLIELMKRSNGQYVVLSEVKVGIVNDMCLGHENWGRMLQRLQHGGHIRMEGGVCYFALKYCAVLASDGNLLVSSKKVIEKVV